MFMISENTSSSSMGSLFVQHYMSELEARHLRHSLEPFRAVFHYDAVPVKIHVAAHIGKTAHYGLFIYYKVAGEGAPEPDVIILYEGEAPYAPLACPAGNTKGITIIGIIKYHILYLIGGIGLVPYDIYIGDPDAHCCQQHSEKGGSVTIS